MRKWKVLTRMWFKWNFYYFLFMVAMHFSIMFWNVQGASSPNFRRAFKTITHSYLPSMVVLIEPQCSGKKADEFIMGSGFRWSHRIEARGFVGGICILWQDAIL